MSTIRNFLLNPWLYIIIVIIGTALKFYHLNYKLFWEDEVSTILYTSGVKGIKKNIPVNQIKHINYYDSLIHLSTKSYTVKSELTGIFSDTHLTPAHYAFLTLWYRIAGDGATDYRLFSVFIFILSLPFLFLLAKTLFNSKLAGWMTVSLYAVSPFINLEAQEARYYILWAFFFIATNYLFLRAVRQNKLFWWIAYVIVSILGLYTSLLSGLLLFGHIVYIFLFQKELRTKFSFSILFIVIAYLPWMYFLYTVRDTIKMGLAWHGFSHSSLFSLDLLFFHLLGFVRSFIYFKNAGTFFMDFLVLLFVLFSFFHLFAKSARHVKWFLALIIFPLVFLFYITDIVRHTCASALWRYQIVNMVGISLVVTNLLKDKIENGKLLYGSIYMGLVLLGITSILKIEEGRCWNTRPDCESNIQEAHLIAHAEHPLLITDFGGWGFANFIAVLNGSKARNADIMYCKGEIQDKIEEIKSKAYSEIYLVQPSEKLVKNLRLLLGERMLPLKKEANVMSPQIWQIKLR
jgi:uncharacterized membrane protein